VQTVAVGSPAWRRVLEEHGLNPDASEYEEARKDWESRITSSQAVDAAGTVQIDPSENFANHHISNEDIASLTELVTGSNEVPFDVYANQQRALAASHLIGVEGQPTRGPHEGYLIFELEKDDSGKWSIQDIDIGDYEDSAKDIDRFLNRTPDAHLLSE